MNRENMEKWIEALETYEGEPARGMLASRNEDGVLTMCAVGIGMNIMMPGCLLDSGRGALLRAWPEWIGVPGVSTGCFDVPLLPDDSYTHSVTMANDQGGQSPWTIAQRLRETYLKEEQ